MSWYVLWVLCGWGGVFIQHQWRRRNRGQPHWLTLLASLAINGVIGPICLLGCMIAYREEEREHSRD